MKQNNKEIRSIGFFEEAVGTLSQLFTDQGFLIARISKINLVIPLEMKDKLRPLIGKRVGILHTDIPGKEYLVRSFQEEKVLAIDETDVVDLNKVNEQCEKASA
jgi:hypothetical protein